MRVSSLPILPPTLCKFSNIRRSRLRTSTNYPITTNDLVENRKFQGEGVPRNHREDRWTFLISQHPSIPPQKVFTIHHPRNLVDFNLLIASLQPLSSTLSRDPALSECEKDGEGLQKKKKNPPSSFSRGIHDEAFFCPRPPASPVERGCSFRRLVSMRSTPSLLPIRETRRNTVLTLIC